MLVLSRHRQTFHDDLFANFYRYLHAGDCIVLNNTRVFPARLHARRSHAQGAEIEVFLVRASHENECIWRTLVRPAKRVRRGDALLFHDSLHADVIEEGKFGERVLRFHATGPLADILDRLGQTPLPPYIHRAAHDTDRERYQTVFAEKRGSAAAPTAGLHFTTQMLDACRDAGADIAKVTLHVGLGTFAPLREQNLDRIHLHEEYFDIQEPDAAKMRAAKRLICIGTTSVRTVETAALRGGLQAIQGETDLFISPGFPFQATGAMLTNFHLPQSSLLILVSAFAGRDFVLAAYRHAVAERYRFFSYGDCMLIE